MSTCIVQLADIHFGAEDKAAILAVHAYIAKLNPDVVLICGDITQTGSEAEFRAARDWISTLTPPRLITPGNHDTPMWNLGHRFFAPFSRYNEYLAELDDHIFSNSDIEIRSVNSARGWQPALDWSLGRISADQRIQSPQEFSPSNPDRLNWLICHHPLKYPVVSPLQKKTFGGPQAITHWAQSRIDAVLTGHVHVPFAIERNPRGGDLTSIGAGTLSTRRRDKPASFNRIEIEHDHIDVVAVQWNGKTLEETRIKRLSRS